MAGKKSKKKMADGGALDYNFGSGKSAEDIIAEMKKKEAGKTGTALASGAASGAAAGSALPGIGTAIGAAVGALGAGAKRLIDTAGNSDIYAGIKEKYSEYIENFRNQGRQARFGYKKGGKVKGAGTAKSDSIDAKIPKGSFLIPAENAAIAMEIGQKLLGWKTDEKATIRQGGEEVDLSNNEVLFQPQEAKALESLGIDLNELAPNAGSNRQMKGGGPFDPITEVPRANNVTDIVPISETFDESLKGRYANSVLAGDKVGEQDAIAEVLATREADPAQATSSVEPSPPGTDPSTIPAGTVMGGAQILGGIAGLIAAEKPIMPSISNDLNQLVTETEREAQYGLEPKAAARAERKIQRNTNTAIDAIGSKFSGGPASRYNRTVDVLNKGNQAVNDLAVLNDNIMQKKKREARGFKAERGRRSDYLQEFAFNDARQGQMLMGDVVSAGIDNIVGSLEYQKAVEAKKRRDKLDGSLI